MLFELVLLTLVILAKSEESLHTNKNKIINYRLPNDTKPLWYDIHLLTKVHIGESNYSAVVSIVLEAVEDTNKIVLHSGKYIRIKKVNLINKDDNLEFENITYIRDENNDFLSIFSEPEDFHLKQGKTYILTLSFSGTHEDHQRGFYRSPYYPESEEITGKEIWIASTFFEPIYARKAFPCYDEPMLKARFSIALTHGANYTALSNMPFDEKLTAREDGMMTTKFKQTPLMSTYTVAFLVGNYDSISVGRSNISHRIFSTPLDKYKGEFALDISSNALHLCEDYFDMKYPLPKIDHISVPMFPAGAMENWGLVIHNRIHLLTFSNDSEFYNLQTANIIVHETVHQWFGNLVTPKWWNYAWLSEGITTFYTTEILEILHPEWTHMEQELVRCDPYLNEPEPHFMSQYVENEKDIWKSFRSIFYCKGFKIMRMLQHALRNETLVKGIRKYLKRHQFSGVEENDLFASLQEAATEDNVPMFREEGMIQKVMSSWTQQKDYPLLTVERNYSGRYFRINQKSVRSDAEEEQQWWIPVTYATSSEANFDDTTTDFILPNVQNYTVYPADSNKTLLSGDWLILNKQQIGMYQIMYDEKNWNLIIEALKKDPKSIHRYNKAQLIRDAGRLETKSLLPSKILFNLLSYLENENEILPWLEGLKIMDDLLDTFSHTKGEDYFKYFARNMINNIYKNITTSRKPTDTTLIELFRIKLLGFLCAVGMEDCDELFIKKFELLKDMIH